MVSLVPFFCGLLIFGYKDPFINQFIHEPQHRSGDAPLGFSTRRKIDQKRLHRSTWHSDPVGLQIDQVHLRDSCCILNIPPSPVP